MSLPFAVTYVMLWVLVLVLSVLVLGLLRRVAPILAKAEQAISDNHRVMGTTGLQAGARVEPFELLDFSGNIYRPGSNLPLPGVFLLVTKDCGPCQDLLSEVYEQAELFAEGRLYVVVDGGSIEYQSLLDRGFAVFQQRDGQASAAFHLKAFPQAFGVDRNLLIVSTSPTASATDLERMMRETNEAQNEVWRA